jgi:hypothetical protein
VREGHVSLNVAEGQIIELTEHYEGLLKVMRPKDKDAMIEKWAQAWRVKPRKTTQSTIEQICLRVYPQFASKGKLDTSMSGSWNNEKASSAALKKRTSQAPDRTTVPGEVIVTDSLNVEPHEEEE